MLSKIIIKVLSIFHGYLLSKFNNDEIELIKKEIANIVNVCDYENIIFQTNLNLNSYREVQELLSEINEKEDIRKSKGVYYTSFDIVNFILVNSIKKLNNCLDPKNLGDLDLKKIDYKKFCYEQNIFDPTCGTGAFLLAALELKINLLINYQEDLTNRVIKKVLLTINGNDLNYDSIIITKLRMLLYILEKCGVKVIRGISNTLNSSFSAYDYVLDEKQLVVKYDIIVGNPPYVEDSKSKLLLEVKYGNIYANVLDNSLKYLKNNGVLGFVIPLSFIATPRMQKIRNLLRTFTPLQYILSFSDRPDSLFSSVHQKLCIFFGQKIESQEIIYTSNYKYWYKKERYKLFNSIDVVKNEYIENDFIPKLGTRIDCSIYEKIINNSLSFMDLISNESVPIYINMRATFWIKAFLSNHNSAEYKIFKCKSEEIANLSFCLLNSSLFWWYWICVSDCWHITKKELKGFKVPKIQNYEIINKLALTLENCLENTKVFIGTKQSEYAYKHKDCVSIIHEIDDYLNFIYGLTKEESLYIKNFAYKYRIGENT